MKLYSTILIPILSLSSFLNLEYKKIKPNNVNLSKVVEIKVDQSASPLFYKLDKPQLISEVEIEGDLKIEKAIGDNESDSYFQLGVIYEGDYRPNGFVKKFLPEWLLKVLLMSETSGVSEIEFLDVSIDRDVSKEDNVRDIKLVFKTVSKIEAGKFKILEKLKSKKVLGFWLRSDGDDSKAKFDLTLTKFLYR